MLKSYREEIFLRSCDCDLTGHWRPGAILLTMQEVAGSHSNLLGIGHAELSRQDLAWVLSRIEVHMDRYPALGETVSVETFPMATRHGFFPRYFIFSDAQGRRIGCAASLWALLNLTTRKLALSPEVMACLPDNRDLIAPLGLPALITAVDGSSETLTFRPAYTDLDVNGHVNNTKYLDWCCNALGTDLLVRRRLATFVINFSVETLPDQTVTVQYTRAGTAFSYEGSVDGEKHFGISGCLSDEEPAR